MCRKILQLRKCRPKMIICCRYRYDKHFTEKASLQTELKRNRHFFFYIQIRFNISVSHVLIYYVNCDYKL